jgi:hypothetical protein
VVKHPPVLSLPFNTKRSIAASGVPRNFFRGGVQQIQLRTEGRENGDLGGGSPLVRGTAQFAIRFDFVKLSECLGLLRMYSPRKWEFGSALSKLRNFGTGGLNTPTPPRYATDRSGKKNRCGSNRSCALALNDLHRDDLQEFL